MMPLRGNPKSECRNPKQIRISKKKAQNEDAANLYFEFSHWRFEFVSDFDIRISRITATGEFRISSFGFLILQGAPCHPGRSQYTPSSFDSE